MKLRIQPDAKIELEYQIRVGEREFRIDLAIESRDTMTLIEFKPRIDENTIYQIYAISHLIDKQLVGKKTIRLVCAGKSLKYSIQELAIRLGVETLLIPRKLYEFLSPVKIEYVINAHYIHSKPNPSTLTSKNTWKIVCSVLLDKLDNILSVSKKTGVSYGWTNNIIHKLIDSGIVTADHGLRIKDMDKLFNLVSWERAMEGLLLETVTTNFSTASRCINELALNLNRLGINYAFTAHSSAFSYGSSIMRKDTAYMYLRNPSDREGIRPFSEREANGCHLNVYVPDRHIMKSSTTFKSIRSVDVCQNTLNLAGLGTDGRIAAKDLVNKNGK
ncbi:hypothetical protein [Ferroplasma acidiphilum]|nr:hypothetical protein [Ferroplasma acidiphilum]